MLLLGQGEGGGVWEQRRGGGGGEASGGQGGSRREGGVKRKVGLDWRNTESGRWRRLCMRAVHCVHKCVTAVRTLMWTETLDCVSFQLVHWPSQTSAGIYRHYRATVCNRPDA